MIEVYSDKNYRIMKFEPKITNLFGESWLSELWLARKVRFLLMYFTGYRIYYMFLKASNLCVAQCVIADGRYFRYRVFANHRDIVVGPIFVAKEMRGKKISNKFLEIIFNNIEDKYENAFAYVRKNNIASIKTFNNSGFCYDCDLKVDSTTRTIKKVTNKKGDNILLVRRSTNTNNYLER